MRILLLIVIASLLLALGMAIDSQSGLPPRQHPPLRQFDPQQHVIHAAGRVEGMTPEIELRTQVRGRVDKVWAEEGQQVAAGDVLLVLDDAQLRAAVALANAERRAAESRLLRLHNGAHDQERREAAALWEARQAELRQAELLWQRIEQLRAGEAVAPQRADDEWSRLQSLRAQVAAAEARFRLLESPPRPDDLQLLQAQLDAAQARWQQAQVQLDHTRLRAPARAQVLKVNVETGELCGPASPRPAVILADTTRLRVRAFVEEMDAPLVQLGMPAEFVADGLPGIKYTGRVTRLSPRMNPKRLSSDQPAERYDTKVREVELEIDDATGLVVGLRVDVAIGPNPLTSASPADPPPLAAHSLGTPAPPPVTAGQATQDLDSQNDGQRQPPPAATSQDF
ncbi:MAG: HlyD family efflux transporter periplasmic adaptor subunit [Planctomycetales bacterium]|nr:HlyD family efflux transporter periplasmic adaptor subunit [Planctomycetales bacterium]